MIQENTSLMLRGRIKSIVILMLCNITGGNAKAYGKNSVNLSEKIVKY